MRIKANIYTGPTINNFVGDRLMYSGGAVSEVLVGTEHIWFITDITEVAAVDYTNGSTFRAKAEVQDTVNDHLPWNVQLRDIRLFSLRGD